MLSDCESKLEVPRPGLFYLRFAYGFALQSLVWLRLFVPALVCLRFDLSVRQTSKLGSSYVWVLIWLNFVHCAYQWSLGITEVEKSFSGGIWDLSSHIFTLQSWPSFAWFYVRRSLYRSNHIPKIALNIQSKISWKTHFFKEKDSFEHLWKTSQKTISNLEIEVSEYKNYLSGGTISIVDVSTVSHHLTQPNKITKKNIFRYEKSTQSVLKN